MLELKNKLPENYFEDLIDRMSTDTDIYSVLYCRYNNTNPYYLCLCVYLDEQDKENFPYIFKLAKDPNYNQPELVGTINLPSNLLFENDIFNILKTHTTNKDTLEKFCYVTRQELQPLLNIG